MLRISHRRVDTADLDAVRAAVGPKTRLVWLESPTNPRQLISDIRVLQYSCLLLNLSSLLASSRGEVDEKLQKLRARTGYVKLGWSYVRRIV